MRADRLISILLLLQQKKKIHAGDLAKELNVSERTIYRDLLVLSSSGFPVYSEKGPGGGCCIVNDYKSSFSKINSAELDALKMINLPESLSSMEMGKVLNRAILKLYAASSDEHQQETYLYIDWNQWHQDRKTSSDDLELLFCAAKQHQKVRIKFLIWNSIVIEQTIDPYGIVAKAGEWFLVYAVENNIRFRRIKTIIQVQLANESFTRLEDFNLESSWKQMAAQGIADNYSYRVKIKASAYAAKEINGCNWNYPFQVLSSINIAEKENAYLMEILFDNLSSARTFILGMGNSIEVLEPEPLRWSVADFARQVLTRYPE